MPTTPRVTTEKKNKQSEVRKRKEEENREVRDQREIMIRGLRGWMNKN
jgi:hypothetical protein